MTLCRGVSVSGRFEGFQCHFQDLSSLTLEAEGPTFPRNIQNYSPTTQCQIPEGLNPQRQRCQNTISSITRVSFYVWGHSWANGTLFTYENIAGTGFERKFVFIREAFAVTWCTVVSSDDEALYYSLNCKYEIAFVFISWLLLHVSLWWWRQRCGDFGNVLYSDKYLLSIFRCIL